MVELGSFLFCIDFQVQNQNFNLYLSDLTWLQQVHIAAWTSASLQNKWELTLDKVPPS